MTRIVDEPAMSRDISRRTIVAALLDTSALAYAGARSGMLGDGGADTGSSDASQDRVTVVDGENGTSTTAASSSAATPTADQFDALVERHANMLSGQGSYDKEETGTPYRALLAGLDERVTTYGKSLNIATDRTYLWNDAAAGDGSANMTSCFVRLRAMAIQYASPGSAHYQSNSVYTKVTNALTYLTDKVYLDSSSEKNTPTPYNNWWDWEIGSPLAALDTIAVLRLGKDDPTISRLLAAIAVHVGNSTYFTGSNATWLTRGRLLRAIIAKDGAKFDSSLLSVKARLAPTTATGNGFRPDASYIEHSGTEKPGFAYTGGYGVENYFHLAWMTYLLGDGGWLVQSDWAILFDWARNAFEPLLFRGAIPGAVMGRNVARNYYPDHYVGAVFLGAAILASAVSTGTDAAYLKSLFKAQVEFDKARDFFTFDQVTGFGNLTMYIMSLGWRTKTSAAVTSRAEADATTIFTGMDRVVHRRPGWAFTVANTSSRLQSYETIWDENVRGYYTGHGMTYFYTQNDGASYLADFWPTVDWQRMPGTTVDTRKRDPKALAGAVGASPIVGGVSDANCGVGLTTISTDGGSFQARKSWIMIGDYIVCQGSGITGTAGNVVETVIENRNIGATGTNAVRMNSTGTTVLSSFSSIDQNLDQANWVHIENVGGYVLPPGTRNLRGRRESREHSWSEINQRGSSPTAKVNRRYITLVLNHGTDPAGAVYSYVFLPNASAADTAAAASANIARIQRPFSHYAALNLGTTQVWGAAFWQNDAVGIFTASAAVAVIVRRANGNISITVSDPTQAQTGTITIKVDLPNSGVRSPAGGTGDAVSVSRTDASATISFRPDALAIKGAGARVVLAQ